MAEQTQEYIKVDEAIYSYINRSEQSNHKFYKLWNIAFDGLTQLGLDFFNTVRSVKLPVNPNKTVNLPDDYLNWSKVGVFNEIGEVIPMSYNSKLTKYADLNSNRKGKTEDDKLWNFFIFNSPVFYNFWNGWMFSPIFGLPSGSPFIGSFKIDRQNGIILLSEDFCYDYVCLEYICSPEQGGEYYLPVQFKEALMWFLAWQDIAMIPSTRRGSLGDKADRRRNFFNERRLARNRWKPFRLNEAYEWALKNTRLTVKS